MTLLDIRMSPTRGVSAVPIPLPRRALLRKTPATRLRRFATSESARNRASTPGNAQRRRFRRATRSRCLALGTPTGRSAWSTSSASGLPRRSAAALRGVRSVAAGRADSPPADVWGERTPFASAAGGRRASNKARRPTAPKRSIALSVTLTYASVRGEWPGRNGWDHSPAATSRDIPRA
jgi:hypothetical protein